MQNQTWVLQYYETTLQYKHIIYTSLMEAKFPTRREARQTEQAMKQGDHNVVGNNGYEVLRIPVLLKEAIEGY